MVAPPQHQQTSPYSRERAPVCVAVLCGLPGAGKTTAAHAIRAHAAQAAEVVVLSLDGLLAAPGAAAGQGGQPAAAAARAFSPEAWQEARGQLLEGVRTALEGAGGGGGGGAGAGAGAGAAATPLLLLVDDNHALASMRRALLRLARQGAPNSAACHGGGRHPPMPAYTRLQPAKAAWEAAVTLVVDTAAGGGADGRELWRRLWAAWGGPTPPTPGDEDHEAARVRLEEARAATAAGLLHSLDLASRRAVSAALATLPSGERAAAAARLSRERKQLLREGRAILAEREARGATGGGGDGSGGEEGSAGGAPAEPAPRAAASLVDGLLAQFARGACGASGAGGDAASAPP
ncbi:MAG: hypothetical protein J3K34DRAFT_469346 [Monoraphidium minutum]|nr:MAG: hypothetical protein J3K34DRAFT_469346 [Monoraphidium minutum]